MEQIEVENLGPIPSGVFKLDGPGVTRFVAPNGSGKSILLNAVQAAAQGSGKVPLRDRTRKGRVEAFGACITIGGTCRHTGAFEVSHIEGRFDLAALVDPGLKTPSSADAARIKALVALTGVKADPQLFRSHEAFADFDSIVKAASLTTDDLIEMARQIKGDFDEAARKAEDDAIREDGQARGLTSDRSVDVDEPCDAKLLQEAYNEARDVVTKLTLQQHMHGHQAARQKSAQEVLEKFYSEADEHADAEQRLAMAEGKKENLIGIIKDLEAELDTCRNSLADCIDQIDSCKRTIRAMSSKREAIETARSILSEDVITAVSSDEMDAAISAMDASEKAVERGALVRKARKDSELATMHRKAAARMRERAEKMRDAGRATDEVLSQSIRCKSMRVESDGKSARLVVDTDRGKSVPYHELSDGEKWTLAIDLGAEQVGKGGLLVISQVGWEGIDGKNRAIIHQHAMDLGVYILTAEASQDPDAGPEIVAERFGSEVTPEQVEA